MMGIMRIIRNYQQFVGHRHSKRDIWDRTIKFHVESAWQSCVSTHDNKLTVTVWSVSYWPWFQLKFNTHLKWLVFKSVKTICSVTYWPSTMLPMAISYWQACKVTFHEYHQCHILRCPAVFGKYFTEDGNTKIPTKRPHDIHSTTGWVRV